MHHSAELEAAAVHEYIYSVQKITAARFCTWAKIIPCCIAAAEHLAALFKIIFILIFIKIDNT